MNVAEALYLRGDVDSYERQEALWLLSHILEVDALVLKLNPSQVLTNEQQIAYLDGVKRLSQHEPLAYILGSQPFWTLDLKVTADTLVPRPDTEVLVEKALTLPFLDDISVLDLGTGTGAIALSLATERPKWSIIATDIYEPTLNVARDNAKKYALEEQVQFIQSCWYDQLFEQKFDLIVSNPPYIAQDDLHLVALQTEPQRALTSAEHGLADIIQIIQGAVHYLKQQGWVMVEHGFDQKKAVQDCFKQTGFQSIETVKDYAGNDRVTLAQLNFL